MKVVFTGPAFDAQGKSIVRSDLTYACIQKGGIEVQPRVDRLTELLVASRLDTVKARSASERGITLMTYPEFIHTYLNGVDIPANGTANRYVDVFRSVKAVTAPSQALLTVMDVL